MRFLKLIKTKPAFLEILNFLEAKDLARLQQVSKELNNQTKSCNSRRRSQIFVQASDFYNFGAHLKYLVWVTMNVG